MDNTPIPRTELVRLVAEAYEHLYDPVFFRTHPLTALLVPDAGQAAKERGWALQRLLLGAIDELDPGPYAPAFSLESRRYQLMTLRYVDGLDPQTVADRVGISRRHFYREHEVAIEALSSIFWGRLQKHPQPPTTDHGASERVESLELLRLEAARLAQVDRFSRLPDVLPGVLALLAEPLGRQRLHVVVDVGQDLPSVGLVRNILREVLLALLSFLAEHSADAALEATARAEGETTRITLRVEPPDAAKAPVQSELEDCLSTVESLLGSGTHVVRPITSGLAVAGFELALHARGERTLLLVDDNADFLELVQRFLPQHGYRVVTQASARDVPALAGALQPCAVMLDLMMPGEDGWETLQMLQNQPDTQNIPVIVCSVLKVRELALSLGAMAFLRKPVSEQALLGTLKALER